MVAICEDLPEPHEPRHARSRARRPDGIPAPKITYRLSENSTSMLEHGLARGQASAGGGRRRDDARSTRRLPSPGWHLMGTARMGTDPETSVVNAWGRCHDVKNLFIIDGSLFVTPRRVNLPTTIQALALYVADAIKQNRAALLD